MIIQTLIPKATVEALNVRILRGLARFDQLELDAILISPLIQCLAGELRSLISVNQRPILSTSQRPIVSTFSIC